MTNDENDPTKRDNPPEDNPTSGDDNGGSGTANDLMGLFAPPPPAPKRSMDPSLFVPPSETDPLLISTSLGAIPDITGKISITTSSTPKRNQRKEAEKKEEFFRLDTSSDDNEEEDDDDDLSSTLRTMNYKGSPTFGDFENTQPGHYGTTTSLANLFTGPPDGGRDLFLKNAKASASQKQDTNPQHKGKKSNTCDLKSCIVKLLAPFALPSTWTGGILFVLYHVVFCMASGGTITRPYSGRSLLGDMARYTALGIIVSCPFLVFVMSDRHKLGQTGIPAMYPSVDLFLAPFIAQAAEIIDKTIVDDWNAGLIGGDSLTTMEPDDELYLNRLWFGSFALVVSFGMFAAGSLLILASKIKLANLGTYLPYGVLCGFFSSVGVLMWKLAITIDTPTNLSRDDGTSEWKDLLIHHLPSLVVGIAMNRLGPKHPFFVTGLIIVTVVGF
eukprot:CAMPEP_0116136838 /NCGR_PEP_ID=MMETSP0329-20121206/11942_1 /TAXON_ID=697910 /ORGANISM="Pseudo-nitzschia arenysensis, Strain B593" /LENGTH=442 /DNA_ID=CAMNT_0003631741 /DNA_START=37 /DNA_END=1365 /DNA_ORIENTATION=-